MSHRAGDGPVDRSGDERAQTGVPSPGTSSLHGPGRAAGDAGAVHARAIPNPRTERAVSWSGFAAVVPVVPSPYGDDYPEDLLTASTTMGIA